MDDQLLMILCGAGALALGTYGVLRMLVGRSDEDKLRDRLAGKGAASPSVRPSGGAGGAAGASPTRELKDVFQQIGQAAAKPFMPKTREAQSGLRANLARAGIYTPSAAKVLVGARVIFLVLGAFTGHMVGINTDGAMTYLLCFALGGLIGYLGPRFWLKTRISGNQRALTHGLADALDLMVVCVEAGLTVDAAMQRIGVELVLAHPALAREFGITHMETRVGLARTEALRNLGARTGNAALQSLASMLIQADRFGTSVAQALRIHAETLRLNRQYAAEEMAAKASVKISFPLVLFIFPSTFIVLCGPTILDLLNSPIFK
jgi:tight adherence protein C